LAVVWQAVLWLVALRMAATQAALAERVGLEVARLVQPLAALVVAPQMAVTPAALARMELALWMAA
jgi:hypothetical protein